MSNKVSYDAFLATKFLSFLLLFFVSSGEQEIYVYTTEEIGAVSRHPGIMDAQHKLAQTIFNKSFRSLNNFFLINFFALGSEQ
jgi:hypothetical protein